MAAASRDFDQANKEWLKFRSTVRGSHFNKDFSEREKNTLLVDPWRHISKLRELNNFCALFDAKIRYYQLIIENNAFYDEQYVNLRAEITDIIRAGPSGQHV